MSTLKPQVTIVYKDEADPDRMVVFHRLQNKVFGGQVSEKADIQLMHDVLKAVIADLEFHRAEYAAYIETVEKNSGSDN